MKLIVHKHYRSVAYYCIDAFFIWKSFECVFAPANPYNPFVIRVRSGIFLCHCHCFLFCSGAVQIGIFAEHSRLKQMHMVVMYSRHNQPVFCKFIYLGVRTCEIGVLAPFTNTDNSAALYSNEIDVLYSVACIFSSVKKCGALEYHISLALYHTAYSFRFLKFNMCFCCVDFSPQHNKAYTNFSAIYMSYLSSFLFLCDF